jgi:hypothetical protein
VVDSEYKGGVFFIISLLSPRTWNYLNAESLPMAKAIRIIKRKYVEFYIIIKFLKGDKGI